jgi:hypothetical protein
MPLGPITTYNEQFSILQATSSSLGLGTSITIVTGSRHQSSYQIMPRIQCSG